MTLDSQIKAALAAERRRDEQIAESAIESVNRKIITGQVTQASRGWRWSWLHAFHPAVALTSAACTLLIIFASVTVEHVSLNKMIATSSVYVSFTASHDGKGTADKPFNSLGQGASTVRTGGTLNLKSGATAESIRIDKPMRLVAPEGQVRIGKI